ncbi:MAG: radical SAM protein [Candidatus Riflebacteria bacterium]|nr:radical SAM protein [Candidatus Riflebacteria bacterium]
MKILVANPPWRKGNKYGIRSGCRFPYLTDELGREGVPLWIPFPFTPAQASALLKKNDFDAQFWDCIAEGETLEGFIARVEKYKPDLYIQEVVTPSLPYDREVFRKIREVLPGSFLVVAGSMVTSEGAALLEKVPFFDAGLTYEWEETALELAERLSSGKSLNGMPGLIHRTGTGIITEKRRPAPDLNALPWSDRTSLPMLRYNDDFAFLPVPNVQFYTSRGCPYRCIFCDWINTRYGDRTVRFRNPTDIADEVEYCMKKWPFKAYYFDDDTFNLKKSHVLSLSEELRRKNINKPWAAMCRADLFDAETLAECRKSGLFAVKYGVESADKAILKTIKKELSIEKCEENIILTKQHGIKVHLTIVIGLPGETESSIRKTWKFLKKVKPDYLQFSIATPYPGTELYALALDNKWIEAQDFSDFNADSQAAMKTNSLSRERIEEWVRKLNLWRIGMQFINNPIDCIKLYSRKAISSPKKIFNIASNLLNR